MAFRTRAPRGDRRLRPAVPRRRRRRRRLLAAAGARLDARLQPRAPSSGTTGATRCAPTGASSAATARPRRCSSASGPRSTTPPATWPGRPPVRARCCTCRAAASLARVLRHLGQRRPSSRSTGRRPGLSRSLPLMPEWYLVIAALAAVSAARGHLAAAAPGPARPRRVPGAAPDAGGPRRRTGAVPHRSPFALGDAAPARPRRRALPRAAGRPAGRTPRHGLTPWRARGGRAWPLPRRRSLEVWSEHGEPPDAWLRRVEDALRSAGAAFLRGGDFDRWDLHVRGGLLGAARLRIAVEEHGGGRQLTRYLAWPRLLRDRRRPVRRARRVGGADRGRRRRRRHGRPGGPAHRGGAAPRASSADGPPPSPSPRSGCRPPLPRAPVVTPVTPRREAVGR